MNIIILVHHTTPAMDYFIRIYSDYSEIFLPSKLYQSISRSVYYAKVSMLIFILLSTESYNINFYCQKTFHATLWARESACENDEISDICMNENIAGRGKKV